MLSTTVLEGLGVVQGGALLVLILVGAFAIPLGRWVDNWDNERNERRYRALYESEDME